MNPCILLYSQSEILDFLSYRNCRKCRIKVVELDGSKSFIVDPVTEENRRELESYLERVEITFLGCYDESTDGTRESSIQEMKELLINEEREPKKLLYG